MAAVRAAPAAPAREENTSIFSAANLRLLSQSVAIYAAITFVVPRLFSSPPSTVVQNPKLNSTSTNVTAIPSLLPIWPAGSLLDILIAITEDESTGATSLPTKEWKGVDYANSSYSLSWDTEIEIPLSVQNNGSLYADIYVTLSGHSPNINLEDHKPEDRLHVRKSLTRYLPERKLRTTSNLFSKKEKTAEEKEEEEIKKNEITPIISYYHPNLTLEMIYTDSPVAYSQLPPNLQNKISITSDPTLHYPILYANDFWLLNENMNPLNSTTISVPLSITLGPVGFFKFQIMQTLDDAFNSQADSGMGGGRAELDIVKRTLTETSAWLLITTFLVSMLHMLFEFLAFTSDISHWKSKKELVGVSVRTIMANCVVQLVVLLYLYDNNENTSWMILGGQAVGLMIELWKITKAVDIKIVAGTGIIPYRVQFLDKHVLTADEIKTQEYDKLAFKWVVYGTAPFVIGYTIYSAIYLQHRSWYSFLLTTATSMVYLGGFIQLIPQLIINYKLKSTAHIPMKAFIFKFLNTIVDDFAAMIIKQPFLHRLAAFRDDVVFLVLLYQMWIYKVDMSRVNEYGQVSKEEEKKKELVGEKKEEDSSMKEIELESKKDR